MLESIHGNIMVHQFNAQNESNNNAKYYLLVPCNNQIIRCAICATNLLTYAMDVDDTDSALKEARAETDLGTDKEDELLRLI